MLFSVSELRNHLSKYLRLVKAGQEIIIAGRGKVIAGMIPIRATAG